MPSVEVVSTVTSTFSELAMTRVEETAINLTVQWLKNNGFESAEDYLKTGGNLMQLAEHLYSRETQGDLQCVWSDLKRRDGFAGSLYLAAESI